MLVVVGIRDASTIDHLGRAVGNGTLGAVELIGPIASRHLERRVEHGLDQSTVEVITVRVGGSAVRISEASLQQTT